MELTTKRLRLRPLTPAEFALLLREDGALEAKLGLQQPCTPMDGHTKGAMTELYRQGENQPTASPWYASWQLISRRRPAAIGSACFMGRPNEQGAVEIGYGLAEPYRRQGYMTEAVAALCTWALAQPGVTKVLAETATGNLPSARVLARCGFEKCLEIDGRWFWCLEPAK